MNRHIKKNGFTILELLVVISVMGIITGIVIAKYRGYGTNALFANATENIVLSLRQAQVYGVGVKGSSGCTTGTTAFDCSYGVYFSTATPNSATLFVDNNNNGIFDSGATPTEAVQTISWIAPITITRITCDGANCPSGGADTGGSSVLDVTFRRPNPAATLHDGAGSSYTTGVITISDGTKTAVITVTKTGQISLQ
jgi:prepilin-type N-terminal cleavage/methylation domain-containing protein